MDIRSESEDIGTDPGDDACWNLRGALPNEIPSSARKSRLRADRASGKGFQLGVDQARDGMPRARFRAPRYVQTRAAHRRNKLANNSWRFAGVAICSGAFLLVRRACSAEKPMPVPSPPARGKGSEEQGRRARMSWRYGRGGEERATAPRC